MDGPEKCRACPSTEFYADTVRPPHSRSKHKGNCTSECDRQVWICTGCRLVHGEGKVIS